MVGPVLVSEFMILSEDERKLMVRMMVEGARKRIPVIANCAGVNAPLAVRYAEFAQKVGADAVIAMPPYIGKADFATVFAYYKAINDAVTIPIMIQNAGVAALPTDQVVRLCTEIERVTWVKEEVEPSIKSIGALAARQCPHIEGVMGGSGGRFMITEWERGAVGCIHAAEFTDVIHSVWALLRQKKVSEARNVFDAALPGIVLEGIMGMAFSKEIMIRRGVFKNHRMRLQSKPLDEHDMREIDAVWERIQPILTWRK
jgi:4-hydroxy-tetrahydrodipicolinate synthase